MEVPPARLPGTDHRLRATLVGASAVLLWSTFASLSALASRTGDPGRRVPPLLLTAITCALAFALMAGKWALRREAALGYLRQPLAAWALGMLGTFGNILCFMVAMQNAPPAKAYLINYLWPVLIVLLSAAVAAPAGPRLRWWHVAGAALGLAGTAVLVLGKPAAGSAGEDRPWLGYSAAFLAAITWAVYSVFTRRYARVPSDAVGWFCAASAVLALAGHALLERATVWPEGWTGWAATIAMGLGPAGAAYFAWDYGIKHGHLQVLGALAYLSPVLSPVFLFALGLDRLSGATLAAGALVVGGAVLASIELLGRRSSAGPRVQELA